MVKEEKWKNFNNEVVKYSDEEKEYYGFLIDRLQTAADQASQPWTELNDMTRQEYYDSNLKASNSYIPPKKNKFDTRVVTGTTEEKENTLISSILNYNLAPNILAYDEFDMEVSGLGKEIEDIMKKTRELEKFEEKRPVILKEFFDQGTCFAEEQWVEETKLSKKIKNFNWSDGIKVKDIEWKEKEVVDFIGCRTNLLRGDKVYLGDMRQFFIDRQPYLFTTDRISYAEAKAIYGNWDRFKYVPKVFKAMQVNEESEMRPWTLDDDLDGFVEVIKYQDKFANEYMIMLNGVMMLPVGFPLTEISPSGEYTIAKGDAFPIGFFALSKSVSAKTKVDQEVLDEMLKLIILKTRKSFSPPYANNTGKVLTTDNLMPGIILNQVDVNRLQEIGTNNGVNNAEYMAFKFIKNIIDEKSVSPVLAGESPTKRQTATEIMELKKQQMMRLGIPMLGVINLERQMAWLRLKNILANYTKMTGEEKSAITGKLKKLYRRIVVDTEIEENQNGKKVIEFSEDVDSITPEQVLMEEEMLSEKYNMPVKKTYISPEIAAAKLNFYINIIPTEKDSSDLQRVMFKQDIQDAINLFGPQTLNFGYLQKRFATLSKQDPTKFFVANQAAFPTESAMGGGDNAGLGAQLNRGIGTAAMANAGQ